MAESLACTQCRKRYQVRQIRAEKVYTCQACHHTFTGEEAQAMDLAQGPGLGAVDSIEICCPNCEHHYFAGVRYCGKTMRCRNCRERFVVPVFTPDATDAVEPLPPTPAPTPAPKSAAKPKVKNQGEKRPPEREGRQHPPPNRPSREPERPSHAPRPPDRGTQVGSRGQPANAPSSPRPAAPMPTPPARAADHRPRSPESDRRPPANPASPPARSEGLVPPRPTSGYQGPRQYPAQPFDAGARHDDYVVAPTTLNARDAFFDNELSAPAELSLVSGLSDPLEGEPLPPVVAAKIKENQKKKKSRVARPKNLPMLMRVLTTFWGAGLILQGLGLVMFVCTLIMAVFSSIKLPTPSASRAGNMGYNDYQPGNAGYNSGRMSRFERQNMQEEGSVSRAGAVVGSLIMLAISTAMFMFSYRMYTAFKDGELWCFRFVQIQFAAIPILVFLVGLITRACMLDPTVGVVGAIVFVVVALQLISVGAPSVMTIIGFVLLAWTRSPLVPLGMFVFYFILLYGLFSPSVEAYFSEGAVRLNSYFMSRFFWIPTIVTAVCLAPVVLGALLLAGTLLKL